MLGPLEAYDRARRAEFVQTLDAFLRAGGNHMRAARHLHVHRNTLIYRLERIQELLGGVGSRGSGDSAEPATGTEDSVGARRSRLHEEQ